MGCYPQGLPEYYPSRRTRSQRHGDHAFSALCDFADFAERYSMCRSTVNPVTLAEPARTIPLSHLCLKGTVQMPARLVIGLNADYRPETHDRTAFTFLSSGYYDAIRRAGAVPVIVPPLQRPEEIESLLERLDGFVLVGGPDLDPRRDGFMLHPTVRTMPSRREDFDRMLMNALAERCIPTFGIGAGMQLMNVATGGNLFLHIPEDLPHALRHADPQDPAHRHGLRIVAGSLMDRVFGDGEIRVNSQHHMSIDLLAPCFEVTARCHDGVIEAIESKRPDWFAIGTQFHPESRHASALDMRIFEEFICGAATAGSGMRMVA
jgi:putative glutamine amidotransferase